MADAAITATWDCGTLLSSNYGTLLARTAVWAARRPGCGGNRPRTYGDGTPFSTNIALEANRTYCYTIAPVSGAVMIAQGSTTGLITVTPVMKRDAQKTVDLTLTPGYYATGTANNSASATLAAVTTSR